MTYSQEDKMAWLADEFLHLHGPRVATIGGTYGPRKKLLPIEGVFTVGDVIRSESTGENMIVLEERPKEILVRRGIGANKPQRIDVGTDLVRVCHIEDAIRV